MPPNNKKPRKRARQYSGSQVARVFQGSRGSFGAQVLKSLPISWKPALLQVEPLYDLEDGKVVTATIVCHLEGFDLRKVLSDDAASNFDQAAAMAPELISWLAAIPGVRVTGEGKVLTHDLVRWSARYLVSEEIGEARGVLTATLTRAEGCSAVLVMDLMEWLR